MGPFACVHSWNKSQSSCPYDNAKTRSSPTRYQAGCLSRWDFQPYNSVTSCSFKQQNTNVFCCIVLCVCVLSFETTWSHSRQTHGNGAHRQAQGHAWFFRSPKSAPWIAVIHGIFDSVNQKKSYLNNSLKVLEARFILFSKLLSHNLIAKHPTNGTLDEKNLNASTMPAWVPIPKARPLVTMTSAWQRKTNAF